MNSKYNNLKLARPLTRATLNKMLFRSLFLQGAFNFERMQSIGFMYAILPGLEKIHSDKEDLSLSMTHNLELFYTHPFVSTFIMGMVISLEQQKVDIPTIRGLRTATMGPLNNIGNILYQFVLIPIVAGYTAKMALDGNILASIIFLLVSSIIQLIVRYILLYWSYDLGTNAIDILFKYAKEISRGATILGVFVIGALTSNLNTISINVGLENEIINTLISELIPLSLTLILYFLIKKKGWSTTVCIILILIIGMLGALLGVLKSNLIY